MTREVVIEERPGGCRMAVLEDGRLIELVAADNDPGAVRDRIFLGRVRAIDPRLDVAFVDCGLDREAWLGARDARLITGAKRDVPIGRQLTEGQAVLVQGTREARQGKGARVTGDIGLAGPFAMLRPRRRTGGVPARLADTPAGRSLGARLRELFPGEGLLLRTAAAAASDEALFAEVGRLRRLWQAIEDRAAGATPPACLYEGRDPFDTLIDRVLGLAPERILVDRHPTLLRARRLLEAWRPALADRLEPVPDAFAATGAAEQVEEALEPVVPLAGGGSLIVETTAALVAIDVNGAGRPALEVDLEAAVEVARQLRLRNLGGIVVVDFVDLPGKRERLRLLSALRASLADDPVPVQIAPPGAQGLVTLTRRHTGPTLADRLLRACPVCAGQGRLPTLARRADALMEALEGQGGRAAHIAVAPDLDAHLRGAGHAVWQAFCARRALCATLAADPALEPGGFVIGGEGER